MPPESTESAAAAVVAPPLLDVREAMREDILGCTLKPGQRLKIEDLRKRYEASVGTLREALVQLVSEGLVQAEVNRGFAVAPVSVADLMDITELRVDLECKALGGAMQEGDDDWEARILGAFHVMRKMEPTLRGGALQDPARMREWAERHRRFHDALVSACPSAWVLRFRQTLFDQARRYRALSMRHSTVPGRLDQHQALMDAVMNRDAVRAFELAELHIRDTTRNVLEQLRTGESAAG
ncbi:FCD domain-containing protein [Paracidovorax cattleyae]|uniref:DNA-binding transcriptional regulator, GntR family n=1 Tax=Paracidovorax cattleyae TaxID=80868 RepID=A0A1H0WBG8_9BURK|nr:FCD domain-containing protein [Paracidovorax cattleyae]SDP87785.1 DNA-binding transcriptional regulator, GntR family [Paracidovorax cattleyae]